MRFAITAVPFCSFINPKSISSTIRITGLSEYPHIPLKFSNNSVNSKFTISDLTILSSWSSAEENALSIFSLTVNIFFIIFFKKSLANVSENEFSFLNLALLIFWKFFIT